MGAGNDQSHDFFQSDDAVFSPCIERDKTLMVHDQGVLTAFDRATGEVRWRLPSVGIASLCFDGHGFVYANSTTATPESIQYSQQIDITRKFMPVILKVEEGTGRVAWKIEGRGWVSHASGKLIYAVESHPGVEESPLNVGGMKAHVRIYRLNPSDGRMVWEYYQGRYPLDISFHENGFALLFRRQAMLNRFWSF